MKKSLKIILIICLIIGIAAAGINLFAASQAGRLAEIETQQAARKQLTICQREIEKLEEAIAKKEAELEQFACDYEKYSVLYAEKEELDLQLLELMEKWEQLAEEAGE